MEVRRLTAIGARIRDMRRKRGLTQAQLGGVNFSGSYISLIESGRRAPTSEVLERIADVLGVSVEELSADLPAAEPVQFELDLRWAELALSNGESRTAEVMFRRLRDAGPAQLTRALDRRVRWGLSHAQEGLGNYRAASETLAGLAQESVETDAAPTITDLIIARARCYRSAGDIHLAIELGEAAVARLRERDVPMSDDDGSVLAALASAYEERGDLQRAVELASEAVAATERSDDPVAAGRALWAASAAAGAAGQLGEALTLAERGLAKFGDAHDSSRLASLQVTKAWIEMKLPHPNLTRIRLDLERTITVLNEVGSPADVGAAQTELSRCLLYQGEPAAAAAMAQSAAAASIGLERARALLLEAQATMFQDGRDELVIPIVELAREELTMVDKTRASAVVWRELAELYAARGEHAEAVAAYEELANSLYIEKPHPVLRQAAPPMSPEDAASNDNAEGLTSLTTPR